MVHIVSGNMFTVCAPGLNLFYFFFNTQIRVSLQFAICFIAFIAQSVN